jgi:hypothetical protein
MGVVFEMQTIDGPDGYRLSGATHGAAQLFGHALNVLCRGDGKAGEGLERAVRLAPRMNLAYVAWAHDLMSDPDLAPLAGGMLLLASRMAMTHREGSHLQLAQFRLRGDRDGLRHGLTEHLRNWPDDALCLRLGDYLTAVAA